MLYAIRAVKAHNRWYAKKAKALQEGVTIFIFSKGTTVATLCPVARSLAVTMPPVIARDSYSDAARIPGEHRKIIIPVISLLAVVIPK